MWYYEVISQIMRAVSTDDVDVAWREYIVRMRFRQLLCLTILVVAFESLGAHPHMWIDATMDFELDGDGLQAVRISWLFDEFNSAEMLFSFDGDLDGEISRAEQTRLRTNAFEHLVDVDYFVIAFSGDERLEIGTARGFRAEVVEGRLLYELSGGQWDIPELRELLEEILPEHTVLNDYVVTYNLPNGEESRMILNARELRQGPDEDRRILLAIEDPTRAARVNAATREEETP